MALLPSRPPHPVARAVRAARFALAVAIALAAAAPVSAQGRVGSWTTSEAPWELCERAAEHGAEATGVPREVLQAIALTETGRWQDGRLRPWPWAVNREGRGFWFASRDEALAFARASIGERRHSFDMGCFQINFHWHGRNFPSVEAMADPRVGAVYAAHFLRQLYAEFGTWSAAAGAYHSRTREHAERYRARFDRILAGLGASNAGPPGEVAAAASGPRVVPQVRRVRAPRIITIVPPGAASEATEEDAEASGLPHLTVELIRAPMVAGRRL